MTAKVIALRRGREKKVAKRSRSLLRDSPNRSAGERVRGLVPGNGRLPHRRQAPRDSPEG